MNKIKKLFCTHRHTIEDHPACFAQGSINEREASKIAKDLGVEWYQIPEYKIGYLDIETDGFYANTSVILTWSLKEKDGSVIYDKITKKDLFTGVIDKRVTESLVDAMSKYKIIVTYYGSRFDVPFIRTRALFHQMEFPGYKDLYQWDLYYQVRNKLRLQRNSLDAATAMLGIEGKTHLDLGIWAKAKYGDKEAIDYVLEHNIADVEILERLHNKLTPFAKWNRTSI